MPLCRHKRILPVPTMRISKKKNNARLLNVFIVELPYMSFEKRTKNGLTNSPTGAKTHGKEWSATMGVGLTLASGKGGTGKTTMVVNLGIALAQFGRDVTLLDADIEMTNLELHLGMEDIKATLNMALTGDIPLSEAIHQGPAGIKVIPTGVSLEGLRKVDPDKLESMLKELIGSTEILLIDAPADKNAMISIATSQKVILIVNPDIISMSDALKMRLVAKKLGSEIIGVILNRVSGNIEIDGNITSQEVEIILEQKVLSVIPDDPNFKLALSHGVPSTILFPDAPGSIAIKQLAANLLGEINTPLHTPEKDDFLKRLVRGLSMIK